MDKKYISFSKLLSRRILMISIATFAVIALLVTAFANDIQQKMTDAYFQNGLFAAHESIGKRIGKVDADSLYRHIKMIDKGFNEFTDRATTSPCSASVLCKT